MKIALMSMLVACAGIVSPAVADIYRWVDADGKVHFSNSPPRGINAEKVSESRVSTVGAQPRAQPSAANTPAPKPPAPVAAQTRKVVMYATSWCGYCSKARQFFKANGVAFTEYDVEANPQAMAEFRSRGGRGYPLIFVGDQRMDGYSEARLAQLLGKR